MTYHPDMTVMKVSRLSRVGRPRVQLTNHFLNLSNAFLPLFLHSIPRRKDVPAYLVQQYSQGGVADKLQGLYGSGVSPVRSLKGHVVTFLAELMEPF